MRRILHRALVAVLAIALSASGAALALASHAPPAAAIEAHHDAAQHAHHHGTTADHAAMTSDADGGAPPAAPHDAFAKCCSMCTLAGPLQPAASGSVTVRISAVQFAELSAYRTGRTIRVEPGIPKSTV